MTVLRALESIRTPFLDYLFIGISHLGAEVVSVIAAFVIYWCVSRKKGFFVLANIVFGAGLCQTLKMFFSVPRPFVKYPDFAIVEGARSTAAGNSFPSGHSQNSTSLFGSLAVLFRNRIVRIICVVMIALVIFSRMYLGAHYPTDVLAGFICGLAVLAFMSFLFRRLGDRANFIPALFGTGGLILLFVELMFEFGPWKGIPDPENMHDMLKSVGIFTGSALAIAVGNLIERRYVRFDTEAVWWAQILKCAAGLGLFGVLLILMKIPVQALFGDACIGYVVRFFFPGLFAVCVWPMVFRRLPRKR